jgi:hypothetical protein
MSINEHADNLKASLGRVIRDRDGWKARAKRAEAERDDEREKRLLSESILRDKVHLVDRLCAALRDMLSDNPAARAAQVEALRAVYDIDPATLEEGE